MGTTEKQMADDTEEMLPVDTDTQDAGDDSELSGNPMQTSYGLTDNKPEQTVIGGILPWIVTFAVAVLCAGAGLTLGRLFAHSRTAERATPAKSIPLLLDPEFTRDENAPATDSAETWFYDLEPVIVNLNDPNLERYIRATITLEIDGDANPVEGKTFLDGKKTLLIDRLTVYLAGLSHDNLRGHSNIEQVRSQILDILNKELFPNSKPRIRQVLLKQLAFGILLEADRISMLNG